jgi:copper transport protein
VTRFSQWALAAVVAIAVSGGFAAWRQVGSLSNVTTTPYGRLVLYKTIGFAVLVGVASVSRRLVHGDLAVPLVGRTRQSPMRPAGVLSQGPGAAARGPQSASQLRRAVLAELGGLAVVLAFSAVLVNAPPARAAVAKPYAAEVSAGNRVLVDVVVEPAKAGPTAVHLYTLDPSGAQFDAAGVDASLNLPSRQIEGLKVPLEKAGPGHWTTTAFDVPIKGHWTMQVTVQLGSASDVVVAPPITVPIR